VSKKARLCRGCAREREELSFPRAGEVESGVELTGEQCWACVHAEIEYMGWRGFQPHGRPPGPLDGLVRKI